ncbi:MAG: sulfurtransferase TusA family protein [Oceanospirillaceae bacterium]
MSELDFDQCLDATAFNCPMPLLKTKQALRYLSPGEVLKVVASDAGAVRDFSAFIEYSEHQMLDMFEREAKYYFYIKRS